MAPPEGSGNAGDPIRSVVEVIARALVDRPDAVRVTENERRGMTVYSLTTAPGGKKRKKGGPWGLIKTR